jgi:hypothetical protein
LTASDELAVGLPCDLDGTQLLVATLEDRLGDDVDRALAHGRRKSALLLTPTAYIPRSAAAAFAPVLATPSTAKAATPPWTIPTADDARR